MNCPVSQSSCDQIDDALRESEERFRNTFDNAAVGMAHVAPDGSWLRVNRRVSEIVGYAPDELITLTFQDITHPDDLDIDLGLLQETIEGERDNYQIDKRYIRKDGSIVWVGLTVGCVRKPSGEVDYFISVLQDITRQKQMHRALAASEARFRAIQQTSPDGFMIFSSVRNEDGRIVDFTCEFSNPAGAGSAQMTVDHVLGGHLLELLPMNKDIGLFDIYVDVVESGRTAQSEIEFPWGDGTTTWFRYTAIKIDDGFAVAFSDISDRKRAQQSLLESEARFRVVQQTTPDGFIIFRSLRDQNGKIADFRFDYVNPAAERIANIDAEHLVGSTMRRRMPSHISIGQFETYVDVVETGEPWQGDVLYPRIIGDCWYRATAAKVGDGFAVSFADITEAKKAEALLQERDQRLRSILNNVVAFVGLLSPEGILLEVNEPALHLAGVERPDVIGQYFWDSYWWSHDSDTRDFVKDAVARAAKGELVRFDVTLRTAGDSRRTVDFQLAPSFDEFGHVTEIIPSGVDISDRKRAEQQREMLVRELSHRVKNSLATVQTIASHTLRESPDLDTFREAFVGRLMAISKCHDLLVDTTRRNADLAQLVRDQVLPYARHGADAQQVTMAGPLLMLGAEASHTFGLILHELATNAAKYGALSTPDGRLDITWARGRTSIEREAIVTWQETGGPEVAPPERRGFGSVLIEQSLAYSLGGNAIIEYRPEGLWAQFRFPKRDRA